jgi:glutamine amidotransferase
MAQIIIVDYGVGNLPSVQKAFRAVGYEAAISDDPSAILGADGLVLPGVGAFGACMANLAERGLVETVGQFVASGRPLLGICVGMQLLFEAGEEFGLTPGLGLLKGRVVRLPDSVKLPQIGWNLVEPMRSHPIFDGLEEPFYAYFVHSYAACEADPADVIGITEYGRRYPSVVARENVIGIQFHPEKSSRKGLQMLANFGRIVCSPSTLPST